MHKYLDKSEKWEDLARLPAGQHFAALSGQGLEAACPAHRPSVTHPVTHSTCIAHSSPGRPLVGTGVVGPYPEYISSGGTR